MVKVTKWREVWQRFSGKGVYPHELAFLLDTRLRNLILPAKHVVDRLQLACDSRVLEIGPGPGYFSTEVARRIPDGELVLFDIQPEMLVKSRAKLVRAGLRNFQLVQGNGEELPFFPGTFDVVFMVTVLGEVPNPQACVASIGNVLRVGGVLSVTEQAGDPDVLSPAELLRLGESQGFRRLGMFQLRGGFTLNLVKE